MSLNRIGSTRVYFTRALMCIMHTKRIVSHLNFKITRCYYTPFSRVIKNKHSSFQFQTDQSNDIPQYSYYKQRKVCVEPKVSRVQHFILSAFESC